MKNEIPQMLKQQQGVIVSASSIAALMVRKSDMPYIVRKHPIICLAITAALENANQAVRINSI
jgi:NAD(P)-dependent dehydrogenase (short-subunit alcohol dehydrogenase family)